SKDYDSICNEFNTTISFNGLNLDNIRASFLTSPLITCLNVSSNNVQSINFNAFDGLPNLRYLDLSNNTFDSNYFFYNGLSNLETLILDGNGHYTEKIYDYRDYNWFRSNKIQISVVYPKLRKLFARNFIYPLIITTTSKSNFPTLTHLYLSGSKIRENDFDWLPDSLEYLDLSGHGFKSFTLKNLKNLTHIILDNPSEDGLSEIDFANLVNLQYLSASSNQISVITSTTFANLSSLLFLDLTNNSISRIDEGVFNGMANLKFLKLSSNNIDFLESGIFDKLNNLETLALDKNVVSVFPVVQNEMKLKELFLNCNKIQMIVGGVFSKMKYLEILHLHDNEILYIYPETFAGLENLKILTLSYNNLSTLPYNWMSPMTSLENLDLTGNNITDLADLSLSNLSPIRNLYLSNQLRSIKTSSLNDIPKNLTISLDSDYVFINKCVKSSEKYPIYNNYD
ncbi:TLR4 interactor with leucine rich repeats-like, partial [Copidosoma floridanum]|uniref:TLR4 interactor with leucine rich repeats-like n=1 Tax=Copidosoma floridanum TaxID=29053 RepID=UPI0006C9CA18